MDRLLIGSFLGDTILLNYYFSRYAIIYCTRLAKKSMLNVYTFLFDWMIAKNEIVRFTYWPPVPSSFQEIYKWLSILKCTYSPIN